MIPIDSTKLPSERSFGLLFTALCAGLGVHGILKSPHHAAGITWLAASGFVLLVTLSAPKLLAPFNKAWFLLGQLLGKVVSPVVLGVIFFGFLTPIAFIARVLGRDELRLKPYPATTYWIDRPASTPSLDSYKNQY